MVAIVANNVDDKIKWNKIAIALAEKTSDERCQTRQPLTNISKISLNL